MTDEPKGDPAPRKPVTLADYIPPEPKQDRKPRRRKPSRAEAERLDALERAVADTEPDAVRRASKRRSSNRRDVDGWKTSKRKSGSKGRLVFWAIVILFVVAFIMD